MSDRNVTIDPATLFDNVDDRQVEFAGDAGAERYQFALRYDVMEALTGAIPEGDVMAHVQRRLPEVERLATSALGRDYDQSLVVISENDLP